MTAAGEGALDSPRRSFSRQNGAVIFDGRRWRIRVKAGRYRFGLHLSGNPAWGSRWEIGSFGAGVLTGTWVRRSRRA